MAFNPDLLGRDEYVVEHLRTHPKKLVGPALLFIVLVALLIVGLSFLPTAGRPATTWIVVIAAGVLVVWWVVLPVLRWLTTTFTFTNRRIITRSGLISRTGHDLPLNRVSDISYQRGLLDRVFGCGTLQLSTSADDPVVLHDIPHVEDVHLRMTEILFGSDQGQTPTQTY